MAFKLTGPGAALFKARQRALKWQTRRQAGGTVHEQLLTVCWAENNNTDQNATTRNDNKQQASKPASKPDNKQAKQASKQARKQANKQANKRANKQASKRATRSRPSQQDRHRSQPLAPEAQPPAGTTQAKKGNQL